MIAADRPEYFPVYYLEPLVGNEAALGFDLASSPTRLAALEKARDTGTVVASAKISLVQGGGARPGVLIFAPIYRTGTPTQSVENRRESLEGYALAVLDIERTLANAINFSEAVDGPGFDVAVFDLSAAQGDQLVRAISADPGAPAPTRQALQSGVHSGVEILVGDRTWLVISTPSGPEFSPLMTPQPWTGFSGLDEGALIWCPPLPRPVFWNLITIDSLGVIQKRFNVPGYQPAFRLRRRRGQRQKVQRHGPSPTGANTMARP